MLMTHSSGLTPASEKDPGVLSTHSLLLGVGKKKFKGRQRDSWVEIMEFIKQHKSCPCKQSKIKESFSMCHLQADVQLLPEQQSLSLVNGHLQRQMP